MEEDLDVPNCERCLVPMVVSGRTLRPFWLCLECGTVRLG
jgi:hypothetical protein